MTTIDFGEPIKAELPPAAARGGRASFQPAMLAWLEKVAAAAPGTYELASSDEDGAHVVSRGTQLRKLVEAPDAPESVRGLKVETRAVVSGKRYRVFVTKEAPAANGGKPARK